MKLMTAKIIALAFIGSITFSSCGSGEGSAGNEDSTLGEKIEAATDEVADAFDGNPNQHFVNDAVELNAKEMAWLSAGTQMGTDAGVKKEAKAMMADHEKMGAEIKDYAMSKSLEIPTVDTKDEVDINEDRGREWDRKWVDKMVNDHEDAINDFENAQGKVDDAELKGIIDNALPKLRAHLEAARALQDKFK